MYDKTKLSILITQVISLIIIAIFVNNIFGSNPLLESIGVTGFRILLGIVILQWLYTLFMITVKKVRTTVFMKISFSIIAVFNVIFIFLWISFANYPGAT